MTPGVPPGVEAAHQLADTTVEILDLRPPVDVRSLVEQHADLIARDFGSAVNCDAVVYGLHGAARPLVALHLGRPWLRARFTLAHELGHMFLAWHGGTISCHPDEVEAEAADGSAEAAAQAQEHEADAFASRLLVPRRFVTELAGEPVPDMLKGLQRAEVSADAGIRSLSNLLPPGYVFALLDPAARHVQTTYRSPGTRHVGLSQGTKLDSERLKAVVDDSGFTEHHGRPIWWGTIIDTMDVPPGTADWKPLLLTIAADVFPGLTPQDTRWTQINGVASNANSQARDESRETLAARIWQAYRLRADLRAMVGHPAFREFVLARTRAFRP